jgi:uncharacterized protein (DUF2267 family)
MSLTGLAPFDHTLHTTNVWLNDLLEQTGWLDRHRAYHAFRAVLHALRDRLPVPEAAALGAQLPMLIRGFYYEGWHPGGKPVKERKLEEFLAHIGRELGDGPTAEPQQVARAVFRVLARHVTAGEIEGIKHVLPEEIRALWQP